MAPKVANKRTGAALAGKPAKKAARVDPNKEKCDSVLKTIGDSALYLPESTRQLLCAAAPNTLTTFAVERGEAQQTVVTILGEVLDELAARFESDVATKQVPVDTADQEKIARNSRATQVEAALQNSKAEVSDAEEKKKAGVTALAEAVAVLKQAEAAQKSGDKELVEAEGENNELVTARDELFNPLKEDAAQSKQVVSKLQALGTKYSLEETLVGAMPNAFNKKPTERGSFDTLVLSQVETAIEVHIANLTKTLDEGEVGRHSRAATVTGAAALRDEQRAALERSETILAAARGARTEATQTLAAAQKAVEDFLPEMKLAMDALDQAKEQLSTFRNGAFADFQDLKELAPEPEPAPAEAAEPAEAGEPES